MCDIGDNVSLKKSEWDLWTTHSGHSEKGVHYEFSCKSGSLSLLSRSSISHLIYTAPSNNALFIAGEYGQD